MCSSDLVAVVMLQQTVQVSVVVQQNLMNVVYVMVVELLIHVGMEI